MTRFSRLANTTLVALAVGIGSAGLAAAQAPSPDDHTAHHPAGDAAQSPPRSGTPGMMMGGMSPIMQMMPMMQGDGMGMMPFDHIEGQIAFYKAELGITDAQLPEWNTFADALRSSAKNMRTTMASVMKAGVPTTAPARMDAMVQMMSVRLDAMKALLAAEKSLYAVLSDDQKKTADELVAPNLMGIPGRGMGAR